MSKKREKLWIPEVESMPPKEQIINLSLPGGTLSGHVEIDLIDAKSGKVKEHYEFTNIILTAGFDGMMDGRTLNSMMTTLTIGTGSTPVSPSDLSLDEEVEQTTNDGGIGEAFGYQTGSGGGPFNLGNPYHFNRRTRVFVENEANFPTLSELGWRSVGSPDYQFTRALIKDVSGNPITIAKTDQDQLRILYELRGYPPAAHFTGSFVLVNSETSHSFTGSGVDIDRTDKGRGWSFSLNVQSGPDPTGQFFEFGSWGGTSKVYVSASAPGNPTGTVTDWGWLAIGQATSDSESLTNPYISGSFVREKQATWDPATAAYGSGGIQGMTVRYGTNEEILALYFTPSIKKTDLQRLVITYSAIATASVTSSL